MKFCKNIFLFAALFVIAGVVNAGATKPLVNNSNIVRVSKLLEQQPLSKYAPTLRADAVDWEAKSKDVVDVVCAGALKPVLGKSVKYGPILIGQFIIGSAAYQIANPAEKGKFIPQQLAGVRSMLKAYESLLAQDPGARVAFLDQLAKQEANGHLLVALKPLVASCQ